MVPFHTGIHDIDMWE